jgi:hypothetical protein
MLLNYTTKIRLFLKQIVVFLFINKKNTALVLFGDKCGGEIAHNEVLQQPDIDTQKNQITKRIIL